MSDDEVTAVPPASERERERESVEQTTAVEGVADDEQSADEPSVEERTADTEVPSDDDVLGEADAREDGDPAQDDDDGPTDFDGLGGLLRERMTQAVSVIEPAAGTLEYLRYAVPMRRRRRQTAMATTAVTVFAVSAGVTLAVRVTPGHSGSTGVTTGMADNMVSSKSNPPNGETAQGQGSASGVAHTPVPAYPATTAAATVTGAQGTRTTQAIPTPPLVVSGTTVPSTPCQIPALSATALKGPTTADGTVYETVTVANHGPACVVTGPPTLSALTANMMPASVGLYRAAPGGAAPGLANPGTWGKTLVLTTATKFVFQFAWVPTQCPAPVPASTTPTSLSTTPSPPQSTSSGGGTSSPTSPGGGVSSTPPTYPPTSSATSPSSPVPVPYSVVYSLNGATAESFAFSAACGASVYLTDIFQPGEYPDPRIASPADPTPSPSS